MSNCQKMKWNRRKLGLSQQALADKVGLSVNTISKLEKDDTAWLTVQRNTEEKLCDFFEQEGMWKLRRLSEDTTEDEKEIEVDIQEDESTNEPEPEVVIHKRVDKGLTTHDQKTLTLIEFAYEGLIESVSHADFVANLKMIKRILDKYES